MINEMKSLVSHDLIPNYKVVTEMHEKLRIFTNCPLLSLQCYFIYSSFGCVAVLVIHAELFNMFDEIFILHGGRRSPNLVNCSKPL